MTLRLVEGFDWLTTGLSNGVIQQRLGASHYYMPMLFTGRIPYWGVSSNTAFSFGASLAIGGGLDLFDVRPYIYYPVPSDDEGVIGLRVYVSSGQTGTMGPVFYSSVDGPQVSVGFYPLGIIKVYRGAPGSGTLLATSSPGAYYESAWFYLEVKAKIHQSAGSVEVRLNTETIISLVDTDTCAGTTPSFNMVGLMENPGAPNGTGLSILYDDLYYTDLMGSVNNGFLGNVRVKTQFAVGNGDNIDFLIGGSSPAATNWQSVSNLAMDDTKFVYSPTIGDFDLYDMNPTINAPYVHAIQVRSCMRQDDATQRIGHNIIKTPSGTIVEGDDHYLNQSFSLYRDIFETNPDTSTFFTGTEANGTQAGPKVDS